MNVPFNSDGPVEVNQADFDTYKALFNGKQPKIDDLVKLWLSEQRPDGVRRLAIRDTLRQPSNFQPNEYIFYMTGESLGRLCNILFKQNGIRLSTGLEFRPKLIDEIASELLYDFKNNRFADRPIDQNNANALISYLVKIADERTGRTLVPYHSVWRTEPFYAANTELMLRDIVDPAVPAWLQAELWENLQSKLRLEIAACEKALQPSILKKKPNKPVASVHELQFTYKTPCDVLLATGQFISLYSVSDEKKDFASLVPIIDFLEKELPAELAYNQGHEMIKIAPRLPDTDTAYNYAYRHVFSEQKKTLSFMTPDWTHFLYWLRGLAAYNHPEAADLIIKIDSCLEEINSLPRQ